jgi:hypothetical protein
MLISGNDYAPSMTKFLNEFSRRMKTMSDMQIAYLEQLFETFLDACSDLPPKPFHGSQGRFNISIFESVFTAVCDDAFNNQTMVEGKVQPELIAALKVDKDFMQAAQSASAMSTNVATRLRIAREKIAQ